MCYGEMQFYLIDGATSNREHRDKNIGMDLAWHRCTHIAVLSWTETGQMFRYLEHCWGRYIHRLY